MANTILTPLMITREALRVLHQKCNFLGNVNKQYDDRFAQSGAKIGTSLNIRMPSKYTVRKTATLAAQDHVERSTPFTVSSQYGVDVSFTTAELTMNLDDFSKRIIDPAMAQLAAELEYTAMAVAYKRIANYTGTTSTQITYKSFQQGGQAITENLGSKANRSAILTPASMVEFADAVKGLFNDPTAISKQYKEGIMGRTGGFDVYENTLIPQHTRGSLAGSPLTTGTALGTADTTNVWASQTTMSVTGATSSTTVLAGDILTFSGVYDVHPETKQNTGRLKKFVVQSDVTLTTAGSTYAVTVQPALIYGTGNAYKNAVLSGVANTSGLTVTAFGVASTAYGQNLQFHEDAFVFGTADLEDVSKYGAWGARDSMDGISMRIARQYAIGTDTVPCRIDVLWGFDQLYPELACRNFYALT